jgi:hypothetical protein
VAARTSDGQGTRAAAFAAAAVVGAVALVVLALVWGSSGGASTIIAGPEDVRGAIAPADDPEEAPHLRVSLIAPRSLVPGHPQSVAVSVTRGDGEPLPADASLVLSAALRSDPLAEAGGVVLVGRSTWTTSAGALHRDPIRLVALGEVACGRPVAELLVRVRAAGDGPPVDATRPLHGPPCDGPEVVAAPASVNLDVPVRYGPNWRELVDRLLDPSAPAPRAPRAPRRAPAPSSTPSSTPTEEEAEEEEPEPEPTREPEPEPTETEEPEPEPTETSSPKPSPTPTPTPKPSDPAPEPPPEEPDAEAEG